MARGVRRRPEGVTPAELSPTDVNTATVVRQTATNKKMKQKPTLSILSLYALDFRCWWFY